MAAGLLLLAGAAGMLAMAGITTPEAAAERAAVWAEAQGVAVQPVSTEKPAAASEIARPSPSPSPAVPVPVVTVEEAWDEEARLTEQPKEPVELPVDESVSLELENDTDFEISFPDLPGLPADLELQRDEPVILIVHTHTTESYLDPDNPGVYRSTDESDGVMAVGDALAETLEARGYGVIHDKTYCDYPEYEGAYDRSRAVIQQDLEDNPGICLVLDVHRDAVENPDGTHMRMAASADGSDAARMMLVVGTDQGGLYHPEWRRNLSLAALIQGRMNQRWPGLMRPINLRAQRFNQDLGTLALLVEMGASGNSLEEALSAAEYLGAGLADVLDHCSGKNP